MIKKIKEYHLEIDLARGIAIFVMIIQHGWVMFANAPVANSLVGAVMVLLGTVPAAPVFLFLMGMNVINSQRSTPRRLFFRGLKLVGLGYVLSAVRFFLPIVIGQQLGLVNPAEVAYQWPPIQYLFQVDILQVAGLSLMGIAFLKHQQVKYSNYVLFALIVALISPLMWQINFSSETLKYLFDPFFGTGIYVAFPFFSWFVYPLVGVYFGSLLKQAKNKAEFYRQAIKKLPGLIIAGIFLSFFSVNSEFSVYYHHGIGASFLFIAFVVAWLSIIHFNHHLLLPRVRDKLVFWSRNVTLIYCLQWIVIGWLAVFGHFYLSYLPLLIFIIVLLLACDFLTKKLQFINSWGKR